MTFEAFQSNAFQNDAFQMADSPSLAIVTRGSIFKKKHSKKETPYRDEIERLFAEAEQVYQPSIEKPVQAQEIAAKPIEIKQISYDVEYLQSIIIELVNLRDNMNGDELERLYVMRQYLDKRKLFMTRARAALLL